MTVVQTALVFAGIPLLVIGLVVVGVYGRSLVHQPNRYRPGKDWTYPASWYIPHPDSIDDVVAERVSVGGATGGVTAAGGASGEW